MNIEEYRAMKLEQEKKEEEGTQTEQPITEVEGTVEVEKEEEIIEKPTTIEIDGEEVSIDELKNGYLRQADYTKKTQKLASERREVQDALELYNNIRSNPNAVNYLRENLEVPRSADPSQEHILRLEEELYDMKLQNDIRDMQSKYEDFEVREVLEFASRKNMGNIEDAYLLLKSTKGSSGESEVDIDRIKEELKEELLREIESNSTSSIISSKQTGNPTEVKEIQISNKEKSVASAMGLTPKEYVAWRDAGK